MHLVDVEGGVQTGRLRVGGACERGLPDARDDEGAEQPARVFAERPLRDANEQQPTAVEAAADIDRAAGLAHDRADGAAKQERAQLV